MLKTSFNTFANPCSLSQMPPCDVLYSFCRARRTVLPPGGYAQNVDVRDTDDEYEEEEGDEEEEEGEEEVEEEEEEGEEEEDEEEGEEEEEREAGQRERHAQAPGSSLEGRMEVGAATEAGAGARRARLPPGGYADSDKADARRSSQIAGVSWLHSKRKWEARATVKGNRQYLGGAVQVDPMKPILKAPGTKHLKPSYDEPPSKFAFKFNLRRYTWDIMQPRQPRRGLS